MYRDDDDFIQLLTLSKALQGQERALSKLTSAAWFIALCVAVLLARSIYTMAVHHL